MDKGGHRAYGVGEASLVVWTVGVVAMESWNFRTLYLARGRRAEAVQRAMDEQGAP
ncbi:MAG: hypothetical protein JWO98_3220 [Frankiales bacterium]|nr:hypothetical protein [Frankiales bacterium]